MEVFEWTSPSASASKHPMSDVTEAAALLKDLPAAAPACVVAEAAHWLESIELESGFTAAHRADIVSMIDEAAHAKAGELILEFLGVEPAVRLERVEEWRLLADYLDKLGNAYAQCIEVLRYAYDERLAKRLPLFVVREMRAISSKMTIGWMRYLPPDRASWESLVNCYRLARSRKFTSTQVLAYSTDQNPTCVVHEFATAVMFAAAAPDSLSPRQIELAHRIATTHASSFACSEQRTEHSQLYMDLERPGAPVRLLEKPSFGPISLFFGPGSVMSRLSAVMNQSRMGDGPGDRLGAGFGRSEKLAALQHAMVVWSASPPVRRETRTRIDSRLRVAEGVRELQDALAQGDEPHHAQSPEHEHSSDSSQTVVAGESPVMVVERWTLSDFSSRGIAARCHGRGDPKLEVGSVFGFRLERSQKWCVAIVRRIRRSGHNHTDIGAEILAKAAALVSLDLGGDVGQREVVLLPETPAFRNKPSLLIEPGLNRPAESVALREGDTIRHVRLGQIAECLDGRERVEFEWAE